MLRYFIEMLLIDENTLGQCEECFGECLDPLFCVEMFVKNNTDEDEDNTTLEENVIIPEEK